MKKKPETEQFLLIQHAQTTNNAGEIKSLLKSGCKVITACAVGDNIHYILEREKIQLDYTDYDED